MPRITITVPEKNAQPYRFELDRQIVTIGRGGDNDIPIESGSVSVYHAEMRQINGNYELHDIGSTNGIKLDETRYEIIPLSNGATVKVGDVAFDFLLTDEEIKILARDKASVSQQVLPREKPFEPAPIKRTPEQPSYSFSEPNENHSGNSFMATLMFLILAAVTFFAGMAIRYQKETGASLINAIKTKIAVNSLPATTTEPTPPH